MDRTLALQDFHVYIADITAAAKTRLSDFLNEHEEELGNLIINRLYELCNIVLQKQKTEEASRVRYFQISLLRSYIPCGAFVYLLSAYGRDYFLDRRGVFLPVRVDCIAEPLQSLKKQLYEIVGKCRSGILYTDADHELTEIMYFVSRRFAENIRRYLWDFDESADVKAVAKEEPFFVKWGGHWEESATVFVGDGRLRNQELFEILQRDNDVEKVDTSYVYGNWDRVVFNELTVIKKALLFQSFRYGSLLQCRMESSVLYGSSFRKTFIKNTVFSGCSFRKCNFRQSKLEHVVFHECDLSGADFRDFEFTEISFRGSCMQKTLFTREMVPFLHLEAVQLQEIRIEPEGADVFFS